MNTLPNPLHGDWVDSMVDWSVTHQKLSEHDLDRFISERIPTPACSSCGGECATPQACEQPDLTVHHARQRRHIAVALMTVGAVLAAGCITAYLRAPT